MLDNETVIREIAYQLAKRIRASVEEGGMIVDLDFSKLPSRLRLAVPQPARYVERVDPVQIDVQWFIKNVVPGLYGYCMNDPAFQNWKVKRGEN
jgi:hypothetical protein